MMLITCVLKNYLNRKCQDFVYKNESTDYIENKALLETSNDVA